MITLNWTKEMNNVISGNNLSYMGKVELYYVRGGKQFKAVTCNAGLQGISELFTRACLGYTLNKYKPFAVNMVMADEDWNPVQSVLGEPQQLRASTYDVIRPTDIKKEEDSYLIGWKFPIFDALITTENMINVSSGNHYLQLVSANGTELAQVKIKIDVGSLDGGENDGIPTLPLREGNNILVKWYMYLSNRTEEDNA